MAYGGWGRYVSQHHNENDSQEQVVEGNVQSEKQLQPQKILE